MNSLLLDVGSTFVKYEIFNPERQCVLFSSSIPFPEPCDTQDKRFAVPEAPIRTVLEGVRQSAAEHGCKSAFISTQMHGYLLRDSSGTFSDYISWRDRRGDVSDPRLRTVDFQRCGMSLKSNLSVVSLCTFSDDFAGKEFYSLGSYIADFFTGVNASHKTDACATGFFYADTLMRVPLFPALRLSRALDKVEPVGKCGDMAVFAPMGDHQVSFLGSGVGEDEYLLNIGTGTQLCTLAPEDYPAADPCELRPYFIPGKRVLTRSGLTGGGKLFAGASLEDFTAEVLSVMESLPPRQAMVLGGGGADLVYPAIRDTLARQGVACRLLGKSVGFNGLRRILDMCLAGDYTRTLS